MVRTNTANTISQRIVQVRGSIDGMFAQVPALHNRKLQISLNVRGSETGTNLTF